MGAEQPSSGNARDTNLKPFERFGRLTKRLASVPKAAVEARRKKELAKALRKAYEQQE
jgi:hypothetical protein